MKAAEKRCRVLWQKIVTLRDGRCLRCGHVSVEGGEMQNVGHHVFGRDNNGSSFDSDSGLTLCPECHDGWARRYPAEVYAMLKKKIGAERYTHLEYLSRETVRLREADFKAIAVELQKELERMRGKA